MLRLFKKLFSSGVDRAIEPSKEEMTAAVPGIAASNVYHEIVPYTPTLHICRIYRRAAKGDMRDTLVTEMIQDEQTSTARFMQNVLQTVNDIRSKK